MQPIREHILDRELILYREYILCKEHIFLEPLPKKNLHDGVDALETFASTDALLWWWRGQGVGLAG